MESVEHDKKDADPWRKAEDSLLRKCIWLEFTIFEGSDRILFVWIAPIERGQIQIAAGQGDGEVVVFLQIISIIAVDSKWRELTVRKMS